MKARRHDRFRIAPAAILILLGLTGSALAQGRDVVRDTTTVVAVEVPVHVLRDGEPVRGLTKDDFEILDGRKRRPITGFEVVDLTLLGAPASPSGEERPMPLARVPPSARRHFLMLFDLSFSDPATVVRARDAARQLVESGLHPTDLVAVGVYTASKGPALLHNFTSDREQALLAIDTLGMPQLFRPARDPLGLVFGELEDAARSVGRGLAGGALNEELHDLVRRLEQQDRRNEEQRITALSRSLADLGKLLRNVDGSKHVLYLSEGFDTSAIFGTADRAAQLRMSQASAEGRIWEVDSEERFGSTRGQNVLEEMFEEFRRADCTIQTVDVGGLRTTADVEHGSRRSEERSRATQATREDSLALMARATGGEFLHNFNNLTEAMGRVLERTGVTYVLTFEPPDLELDGSYHKLEVRLAKDAGKARVVHRPGYYAPRPFAATSADERRLAAAQRVAGGGDGGHLETAVLALTLPPAAGPDVYVPLVLEIDGADLGGGATRGTLGAEIYAYAIAADGRVRDFLSHSLTVDLAQAGAQLASGGIRFFGHLDLPAGAYELRTFVRDSQTGVYGLRSTALVVPDFAVGEAVLLPPLFPEAPGRWLMLREELAAGEEAPFPFMARGQPYIPGLRPVVSAGGETAVEWLAYGLGDATDVAGRVLDAAGAEVAKARLTDLRRADGAGGRTEMAATLKLGRVPAGDYFLEVTASSPGSGVELSRRAPFSVR